MVALCPLQTDHDKKIIETNSVGVLMRCQPFVIRTCMFEIEQ